METYFTQITNYLLTQSWQIAVLVAVIAAATLALKNRSAHFRYLLWLIVLAKCLVPPLLTVPLAVLPEQQLSEPIPVSPPQVAVMTFEEADVPAAEVLASPRSFGPVAPVAPEKAARFTLRQWLGLAWAAGVAVFLLFAAIKASRTNHWLRRQRRPLPIELRREIEDLFSEVGVRKFPKVWLVEGIGQPFVWGLCRGSIYLPADFVKVNSAEHRREVLSHELSHVLRFDAAVNFLQILAQTVFWFHPLVWWSNRKIRAEREKCCDEMAIAQLGAKAKDYSSAIVNTLINEYESTRPVPSLAIAGPVKNIEERIKTIMKPGKRFYKRPSSIAVTVVLLLALLTVPTVLVLTARAGTRTEETGSLAQGTVESDPDTSETSESSRKVTCTGKVVDTQGRPIAGAKVTAYESHSDGIAGNVLLRQIGKVTTKGDGAFVFTTEKKPVRGSFFDGHIVATKQGLALGWANWAMREDAESDIVLGEPEKLEGVIVDETGKPVVGAEVRVNLNRIKKTTEGEQENEWLPGIAPLDELGTQTNSQGRFFFSNLSADLGADLLVIAAGKATTYTYQQALKESAFKAGQTDISVVLLGEARIEGRIVNASTGKGIPGVALAIVPRFSPAFFDRFLCVSKEDGTFAVGGLRSGKYLIRGDFPPLDVNVESGMSTDVLIAVDPQRVAMPEKETPGASAPSVPIDIDLKILEVPVGVETGVLEQKESLLNGMSAHIGQEYADKLLGLSQDNARARRIANPQLTIADRYEGAIISGSEQPYIAGYELAKDGSGKLTPHIKYFDIGSEYKVRPILKSGGKIHISLAMKQSYPIFETLQYREGYDYKIPSPGEYFSTDVIAGKNEPVVVGWLRQDKPTLYVVMTASWQSRPEELRGKKLPKLNNIGTGFDVERFEGRPILVCFWDVDQRPSRHCIGQLVERMEQFREKGVTVVVVQASKVDEKVLNEWAQKNAVPFPVGMVRGDVEKVKAAWGVRALPWLILADRNHIVSAEGFVLDELDEKIEVVTEK
jgi:beta-lactamase regulating signal transducer with metallopeptidase domain